MTRKDTRNIPTDGEFMPSAIPAGILTYRTLVSTFSSIVLAWASVTTRPRYELMIVEVGATRQKLIDVVPLYLSLPKFQSES